MSAPESKCALLVHDREMAADFLSVLDPTAQQFTFQFFSEWGGSYAEVFHGTLDAVWHRVLTLNTPARGVGVFVTINETDFKGRRRDNVVRARALWVDADSAEQVGRCEDLVQKTGATPTMIVRTSPGRAHFYFCCDDVPLDEFSDLQVSLIAKLGTDPAVKDLPRVMRLPGTVHLKNPSDPRLVTFDTPSPSPRQWKLDELKAKLELATSPPRSDQVRACDGVLNRADADRLRRIFGCEHLTNDDLSSGIETNIEEVRSAASAIPASAVATEPQWVRFARGLAHEAMIHKGQAEQLWEILDAASRQAPGYEEGENRERWSRYIDEAANREQPITIATVFDMAHKHGWQGWTPPTITSTGNTPSNLGFGPVQSLTAGLNVTFGDIPHRRWLYGVDLVRGEITLLAAPGGVGKSSLALGMNVALATGSALLKERVWDSPLTSLYINAEDSAVEMRRRIWAFCLHHGVAEEDLERFLLLGADDWRVQKLSFLRSDKGASLLNEAGIQHLEALLAELRPDLLVLDPLVALCGGGNLNDNAAMSLVMRALKGMANKYDCAVLVLHHTRKGGDLSHADAIGGASAIVNLARRALMAMPMSTEEAAALGVLPSERSAYIKTASSKSNLAPRSDDAPWYKLCNVSLPNAEPPTYASGDNVQAIKRVQLPRATSSASIDDQKIRRAILDVVARGKPVGGEFVPYSPNLTGAKNERALVADAAAAVEAVTAPRTWHRVDLEAVVARTVNTLKSERALVEEVITSGRFRRGRGLRVDWSRTAWPNEPSTVAGTAAVADTSEPSAPCGGKWVNGVVND